MALILMAARARAATAARAASVKQVAAAKAYIFTAKRRVHSVTDRGTVMSKSLMFVHCCHFEFKFQFTIKMAKLYRVMAKLYLTARTIIYL